MDKIIRYKKSRQDLEALEFACAAIDRLTRDAESARDLGRKSVAAVEVAQEREMGRRQVNMASARHQAQQAGCQPLLTAHE